MSDARIKLGRHGEALARSYLETAKGMTILAQNWRCRLGELDLVAASGDWIVFVEVRTRRLTGSFGMPEESVNWRKRKQVRETALHYLKQHGLAGRKIRFDVVAVTLNRDMSSPEIRHIEAAF